jgi:catechol 2,3-dioxygenase-like lactoylglutathione lyase family enzyme
MPGYVAIWTNRFDLMVDFYGERLGFQRARWPEDPHSREALFEMPGFLLKLVDNDFERNPRILGATMERVNLVIEVEDIEETRDLLDMDVSVPNINSLGERAFQVRDPDGLIVIFLEPHAKGKPTPSLEGVKNDEE